MASKRGSRTTTSTGSRLLSVVAATRRDLAALGDKGLAQSGLAAAALRLARELDSPDVAASAKASCARALRGIVEQLRVQATEPVTAERLRVAVEAVRALVEETLRRVAAAEELADRIGRLEQLLERLPPESGEQAAAGDAIDELAARRGERKGSG